MACANGFAITLNLTNGEARVREIRTKRQLELLLKEAQQDDKVLAVMLFGNVAKGESSAQSDVDICLVLYPKRWQLEELARKRWEYLRFDLDIKIFQQLPLYVYWRVLKEGVVLLLKDDDQLYELAFRTAKGFEDFKHVYSSYTLLVRHTYFFNLLAMTGRSLLSRIIMLRFPI